VGFGRTKTKPALARETKTPKTKKMGGQKNSERGGRRGTSAKKALEISQVRNQTDLRKKKSDGGKKGEKDNVGGEKSVTGKGKKRRRKNVEKGPTARNRTSAQGEGGL